MNELEIVEVEEKERFEITDLGSLNWVFREVLIPLKAEVEANNAFAKTELARVNDWLKDKNKASLEKIEYFEHLVQNYHHQLLLNDPKAKTLSTPYGKSKSRASKAAPEQADKDALLVHLLSNDMQDYIKKEPMWGDFKKSLSVANVDGVLTAFDETGQAVPGVVIKPESINFTVEVT